MNSSHKIVRSIWNTTLKLCADYAKQFVRNTQNCGKINYGFCTMITHQLTDWCLCLSFWPKITPQLPYSPSWILHHWNAPGHTSMIVREFLAKNHVSTTIFTIMDIVPWERTSSSQNIDACVWVFGQKQNNNHASTTVFIGLGRRWLFPLPKTEASDERNRFC